jgi:monovalent cation:H+ antiporter-2, CPA2 family
MAAAIDPGVFKEALIVLAAAAVVIPIFVKLKVSPVLGFLLVGMVVGPYGFGALAAQAPALAEFAITETDRIALVAELGVVLLLFMIGLELSFNRIWLMRRLVFGVGGLQVLVSTLVLAGVAHLLGLSWEPALVVGLALAMSSTAIIIQVLAEEKRLALAEGRATFSVLLFQDIAVVPILFVVTMLGQQGEGGGFMAFVLGLGQAVLAVAVIVVIGRQVLRPLFRLVAQTRSTELFMAACLLVIIGTGLLTALAGLSMALGALIAGILLAETEYRRQIEVLVEPFKGLLLGVFLISIGMSINLPFLAAAPALVLGAALGLVLVKAAIVLVAARGFGLALPIGLKSGLLLGPGSEFTFVILGLAVSLGVVAKAPADFALLIAALTMAVIPLLSAIGVRASTRLPGARSADVVALSVLPADDAPRVIVAGFGRVGRLVAAMLEAHKVPYLAIDADADRVARERKAGRPIYFGDMRNTQLLHRCGLGTATALVVTLDDADGADRVVQAARAERADLLIVARAKDASHAAQLYRLGASDAVPETIEASLQLAETLLVDLGKPMGPVIASIHEKRAELRQEIQTAAPGLEDRLAARRRLRDLARKS